MSGQKKWSYPGSLVVGAFLGAVVAYVWYFGSAAAAPDATDAAVVVALFVGAIPATWGAVAGGVAGLLVAGVANNTGAVR